MFFSLSSADPCTATSGLHPQRDAANALTLNPHWSPLSLATHTPCALELGAWRDPIGKRLPDLSCTDHWARSLTPRSCCCGGKPHQLRTGRLLSGRHLTGANPPSAVADAWCADKDDVCPDGTEIYRDFHTRRGCALACPFGAPPRAPWKRHTVQPRTGERFRAGSNFGFAPHSANHCGIFATKGVSEITIGWPGNAVSCSPVLCADGDPALDRPIAVMWGT
jgi:hypothetical protein